MKRERQKEILRFIIIGGLSFVIDYGLLWLLVEVFDIYYFYAAALSFIVSFLFNWWANIVWVFKAGHQSLSQQVYFVLASVLGLGINQLFMWFLVEVIALHYMIAKILATIAVSIWNYLSRRKIVLKKENS